MSKILSQEEVEALLNTIENSNDSISGGQQEGLSYRVYDFKKKKGAGVFDISVFEFIADKLVNNLKPAFATMLLKNVKLEVKAVKTLTLKEFKDILHFPTGLYILRMKPLEGKAIIAIDDVTVFAFVELFFGGNTVTDKKFEDRPFTLIEQKVIKKVVVEMIEPIKKAFSSIYNFEPEILNLEMRPKFINFIPDRERLAFFDINLMIDDFLGKIYFALPFQTLEPIEVKLSDKNDEQEQSDRESLKEEMINAVMEIPINVVAELAQITMTIDEIRSLNIGDVIPLGKPIDDELNVYVEGELKFKGKHGIYKGNQAVKITKVF